MTTTHRCAGEAVRPAPITGAEAGARGLGGWINSGGKYYAAKWREHLKVAADLRATGNGPADPWLMRDGWIMVGCDGEVIALPTHISQPQLDTLSDILNTAHGTYRDVLRSSLRTLLQMAP